MSNALPPQQRWTLTDAQRRRLETCRNDFKQGLPGARTMGAVAVYNCRDTSIPWKSLAPSQVIVTPISRVTLSDELVIQLAVFAPDLTTADINDYLVPANIEALMVLSESHAPMIPSDWSQRGSGCGGYWIAKVFECVRSHQMGCLIETSRAMRFSNRSGDVFQWHYSPDKPGLWSQPLNWPEAAEHLESEIAFPHDFIATIENVFAVSPLVSWTVTRG